ncbi:hypothetical protein BS78_02G357000 [Paspalum vaginatum]|nr:hypothetical protein BS78_02G357000 [Paspalum vaginatum]
MTCQINNSSLSGIYSFKLNWFLAFLIEFVVTPGGPAGCSNQSCFFEFMIVTQCASRILSYSIRKRTCTKPCQECLIFVQVLIFHNTLHFGVSSSPCVRAYLYPCSVL